MLAAMLAGVVAHLHADEPNAATDDGYEVDWPRIHATASRLWDDYAPYWISDNYQLVTIEELKAMFAVEEAADRKAEQRARLDAWTMKPVPLDYAARLRDALASRQPAPTPAPTPTATAAVVGIGVPLFPEWLERMKRRPRPARADDYLPVVRRAFADAGVPEALVWLAETESSFDPRALSPVGARGLFQLMPRTARSLGLSLFPLDQRTHPEASAAAAAAYLRKLHARFGDWPLALAAYNAGEGLVSRRLKASDNKSYAGIADLLPAETRHYVPKVLATVQVRAGVSLAELDRPYPRG